MSSLISHGYQTRQHWGKQSKIKMGYNIYIYIYIYIYKQEIYFNNDAKIHFVGHVKKTRFRCYVVLYECNNENYSI